ncbi:MAG: polysaccharide biosynthesis protein [Coriobacteriia bacterium]|nr:polysaccharide biosynthesis protein [Coriobacteriia bacterium]
MFEGKTLLVTGGTGSFGHAVVDRFLGVGVGEIRVFSRDELKQDDMRHRYQHKCPELCDKIKFYIGDVRDIQSVANAMHDVDYVFHAAALKQVPSCEFFPMEAVKTNVLGTENVLNAAITAGAEKVICLSTDKAAYPINAMGTSKAMMEKVYRAKSRTTDSTLICGTRYGNVLASRGSVVPLFVEQIKSGAPLTVTDPEMTRFLMTLEQAVELVVYAFNNAQTGDLMVQKAPASTIGDLARAILEIFGADNEIRQIGVRHGEKKYETLLTFEERSTAEDLGGYFRVPADRRDLNYDKYFTQGLSSEFGEERVTYEEYTSRNTDRLSVQQIKDKLLTLDYIQRELAKWQARP